MMLLYLETIDTFYRGNRHFPKYLYMKHAGVITTISYDGRSFHYSGLLLFSKGIRAVGVFNLWVF